VSPELISKIDPNDKFSKGAQEIGLLIKDSLASVGDAFFTTYMQKTGLREKLSSAAISAIERETHRYVEQKLLHFKDALWAQSAADCVRNARKHGVSVRSVLTAVAVPTHGGTGDQQRRFLLASAQPLDQLFGELDPTVP